MIVRIPVDAELAAEAADHVVAQTQFFEIASQHLLNLSVELVGRDIERLESLLEAETVSGIEIVTIEFRTVHGDRQLAEITMMEATRLATALKEVFIEYLGSDAPGADDGE